MSTNKRPSQSTRTYVRFSLSQRLQHLIMLVSFTGLALTGLPQKYPLNAVSIFIVRIVGSIEMARTIHHISAVILMLVTIYHILEIGYKIFVLRVRLTMLPTLQDVKDAWLAFTYNLGFNKKRPQMGRYTFEEKAEYWALVWGIIVMGLTGFLMWNPIMATRLLPGEFIPAAKAAHGGEAVLAVLAIIVWHMYGVHIKRFNKAMWTGRLTEEEMLHEHPLELADLKAGNAARLPDPATLYKRQRIYFPIAILLAALMLASVYWFVAGEQTAITTIPRPTVGPEIFVPQTATPLPTPIPTNTPLPSPTPLPATAEGTAATPQAAAPTWNDNVGPLFQQKCAACHGAAALGGLNLTTYADAMKGGQSGPAILAGDAENSLLIQKQKAGGHPGQLLPEEIAQLIAWIQAGAPEK